MTSMRSRRMEILRFHISFVLLIINRHSIRLRSPQIRASATRAILSAIHQASELILSQRPARSDIPAQQSCALRSTNRKSTDTWRFNRVMSLKWLARPTADFWKDIFEARPRSASSHRATLRRFSFARRPSRTSQQPPPRTPSTTIINRPSSPQTARNLSNSSSYYQHQCRRNTTAPPRREPRRSEYW